MNILLARVGEIEDGMHRAMVRDWKECHHIVGIWWTGIWWTVTGLRSRGALKSVLIFAKRPPDGTRVLEALPAPSEAI